MGEKKIKELWTMEDLIAYLKMPRSTVYELVAKKTIPVCKLGKHQRFVPDDVEMAIRKLAK